jgi:uncharacterized repeat protein (TIGR03943 family)
MRKDAQAVLLLLVGGTLLKISLAGTYVRYVKVGQFPLLVSAGAVLVLVGLVTLWQTLRPAKRHAPAHAGAHTYAHHAAHDGHGSGEHRSDEHESNERESGEPGLGEHVHGEPRVGWLMLAPALALLLIAPPALGAFQASRNGTALQAPSNADFAPLPDGDPVRISVLDYASRAVFDHGQSLRERRVTLSGFIIAGPHGQPYLARMIVTCCAADARPVKVGLTGDVPGALAPDQWVEVVGTYTDRADRDSVNGEIIPYLQVVSTKDIAAPAMQYES